MAKKPHFFKEKISEAIILAGGMGTRLRPVVSDRPKPLAIVAGKPFIFYLLDQLTHLDIQRVVISVGYMSDMIVELVGSSYKNLQIDYAIEVNPLGTGGGLMLAIQKLKSPICLVLNGDTYFEMDFQKFIEDYLRCCESSVLSIALMTRQEGSFGFVTMKRDGNIQYFGESRKNAFYISAGRYLLNVEAFLAALKNNKNICMKRSISLEDQIIPLLVKNRLVHGLCLEGFFIDIGSPAAYLQSHYLLENFQ